MAGISPPIGAALELELNDRTKALGAAAVRFKQEHPELFSKINRRRWSEFMLILTVALVYFPMAATVLGVLVVQARAARPAPLRAGPADATPRRPPPGTNGAHPPASQPGLSGEEIVLAAGVPDGGKIDFGA